MVKKLGFFVLLMAAAWLASACETLNGDPLKGVVDLDVGDSAACAIDEETSEIECWGQLLEISTPVVTYGSFATPVDPGVAYEAVGVGRGHACAVKDQGAGVRCWGSNQLGKLGDGTSTDSLSPVDVVGLPNKTVVDLSVGGLSTCATFSNGTVYCWGANSFGQLGDGTTAFGGPNPVIGPGQSMLTGVARTAVGITHACALKIDQTVLCWGDNSIGQLGVGSLPFGATQADTAQPVSLVTVDSIAMGSGSSCATTTSDLLYCWGSPLTTSHPVFPQVDFPTVYSGFSQTPVEVSLGFDRICARFSGGTTECVGSQFDGGLGDGSTANGSVDTPVTVTGSDTVGFAAIHQTSNLSCARTLDPEKLVRCWGDGDQGQIGNGEFLDSPTPVLVVRP